MKTLLSKFVTLVLLGVLVVGSSLAKEAPPEGSAPKDFQLAGVDTFTLENGMKVSLVDYGRTPKATVGLIMNVGNRNEGANTWLSDISIAMLKDGTRSRSDKELAAAAASMGGNISINTALESSSIFLDVLAEKTPQAIELIAEMVKEYELSEAALARQLADSKRNLSVIQARAQSQANEAFYGAIFGDTPYGRYYPTEEQLDGYTLEKASAFLKNNLSADQMHVYVSGVFNKAQAKAAIREHFADVAKVEVAEPAVAEAAETPAMIFIDRPGAPQSTVRIGGPVAAPGSDDYVPLTVMNALLAGSFGSRITSNIREDKGYTYSPRGSISTYIGEAVWLESADITTESTVPAINEVVGEIERLQNELPSPEEVTDIQNYLAGTFILRNASRGAIINQLAFLERHGLPKSYLTGYTDNVYSVTPQQITDMAKTHLPVDKMSLVIVGDSEKVKPQLKDLKGIEFKED